jgi:hypothetical protein
MGCFTVSSWPLVSHRTRDQKDHCTVLWLARPRLGVPRLTVRLASTVIEKEEPLAPDQRFLKTFVVVGMSHATTWSSRALLVAARKSRITSTPVPDMEPPMNFVRKTTLVIAIAASAALSSAAMAQDDLPPAWSFGGKNSPFINPSDVSFPRPSAAPNGYSHRPTHHVKVYSRDSARY